MGGLDDDEEVVDIEDEELDLLNSGIGDIFLPLFDFSNWRKATVSMVMHNLK